MNLPETFNVNYEGEGGFHDELQRISFAGRELNTVLQCLEARLFRIDERNAALAALKAINALRDQVIQTRDKAREDACLKKEAR